MSLKWQTFVDPEDTTVLIDIVRRMDPWNEGGVGWLHPGDVVWRLYQNLETTPEDEYRIVTDARGEAVALVEMLVPDAFYIHMADGAGDLEDVIRFASERAMEELRSRLVGEGKERPERFETEVLSTQLRAAGILCEMGFGPAGEPKYRLNGITLGDDLPFPRLRSGATVRSVRDDPTDLQARVDLHRGVWAPSKFTLAGYQRLRTKPLYRPDLDLVVETADGELAAYCIVWWDPVTRIGEFEPVGTAERFRGQGYAKAILHEGMRRLREFGATHATVLNAMGERWAPSRALYPSAGFTPIATFERYRIPV
jgi:ribosomal protein S18 acetylase RimI-like enzyme